jgi:hypothetical protein
MQRSRVGLLGQVDGKDKLNLSNGCIPTVYLNPFTPGGRAATDSKIKNRMKR